LPEAHQALGMSYLRGQIRNLRDRAAEYSNDARVHLTAASNDA
jgi:hypothetical protein